MNEPPKRRPHPRAAANDLMRTWADRDERYRLRKAYGVRHPLSPEEAASIREFRRSEIRDLPFEQQAIARERLIRWEPPRLYE